MTAARGRGCVRLRRREQEEVMRRLLLAAVALLFLSGCSPAEQAQPTLPKTHLTIDAANGPAAFDVEMATTVEQQKNGLMFRRELGPNEGMLFDFGREDLHSFWMKNTILPLDMLFIRADGTISTIAEDTIPFSEAPVASSEPVRAVLEINAGRARALGILPGAKVHADIFGKTP
jgi:uncharacterized membrane protein (UPF0127 family)